MPISFDFGDAGSAYLTNPLVFGVLVTIILLAVFYWNTKNYMTDDFQFLNTYATILLVGGVVSTVLTLISYNYVESKYKDTYASSGASNLVQSTIHSVSNNVAPNFAHSMSFQQPTYQSQPYNAPSYNAPPYNAQPYQSPSYNAQQF